MKKTLERKPLPMPDTSKGLDKLSKCALWWLKHPYGIEMKINDMRAVMR